MVSAQVVWALLKSRVYSKLKTNKNNLRWWTHLKQCTLGCVHHNDGIRWTLVCALQRRQRVSSLWFQYRCRVVVIAKGNLNNCVFTFLFSLFPLEPRASLANETMLNALAHRASANECSRFDSSYCTCNQHRGAHLPWPHSQTPSIHIRLITQQLE